MWKYNETSNLPGNSLYHSADELYHYGVLGMRWGHHKIKRYKERLDRINTKREKMYNKGQVANRKYINASKKQFELKNKISLEKAKIKNDKSEIILRKERFKESKYPRKYGTLSNMLYPKNELKSIYGNKLSDRQISAIRISEDHKYERKRKTKNALKAIGSVGVTAIATSPIWYPMVKQGSEFIKNNRLKKITYDLASGSINLYGIKR